MPWQTIDPFKSISTSSRRQRIPNFFLFCLNTLMGNLIVHTTDGRLRIDNNLCENVVRPFVMGSKSWLFAALVDGANASANLYSMVETAKANGLEPHSYFQHVLTNLPAAQSL